MRKVFSVIIYDKERDVYDIPGKEHPGYNGEVKTWWIYMADRLPDGITPAIDSPDLEPWSNSITRHLWDIKFSQKNTTKEKWGETQFRNHTAVEMWCNKRLIYSFSTWGNMAGMSYAMAKVQYLQTVMSEHPYNFFEPEENKGRKIYFYGMPASVEPRKNEGWEIKIIPDYTDFTKEKWWSEFKKRRQVAKPTAEQVEDEELMEWDDAQETDYINWGDALSDGNINWFRNDTPCEKEPDTTSIPAN